MWNSKYQRKVMKIQMQSKKALINLIRKIFKNQKKGNKMLAESRKLAQLYQSFQCLKQAVLLEFQKDSWARNHAWVDNLAKVREIVKLISSDLLKEKTMTFFLRMEIFTSKKWQKWILKEIWNGMGLMTIYFSDVLNNISMIQSARLLDTKKPTKKKILLNWYRSRNMSFPKKVPVKVHANNRHKIFKLSKLLKNKKLW